MTYLLHQTCTNWSSIMLLMRISIKKVSITDIFFSVFVLFLFQENSSIIKTLRFTSWNPTLHIMKQTMIRYTINGVKHLTKHIFFLRQKKMNPSKSKALLIITFCIKHYQFKNDEGRLCQCSSNCLCLARVSQPFLLRSVIVNQIFKMFFLLSFNNQNLAWKLIEIHNAISVFDTIVFDFFT